MLRTGVKYAQAFVTRRRTPIPPPTLTGVEPIIAAHVTPLATAAAKTAATGAVRAYLDMGRWRKAVAGRAAAALGEKWVAGAISSWLKDRKAVWPLMERAVEDGDYDALTASLSAVIAKRRPALSRADRDRMALTCIETVMGNLRLDLLPAWAIHIEHLWMRGELGRLREGLQQDKAALTQRALLPPLARLALDQLFAVSPETARDLLWALTDSSANPGDSLRALVTPPLPNYLTTGAALAWGVIGETAVGHLEQAISIDAFERAALAGAAPRHRWMGRAAMSAAEMGDRARAAALVATARPWAPASDAFLDSVQGVIDRDWGAIEAAGTAAEAAGDEDRFIETAVAIAVLEQDKPDDAVRRLRRLRARDPDVTGITVMLAQILTQVALRGAGTSRPQALREVIALALDARDRRRRWRGPSYQAVEVACDAHLALREVKTAQRLAMPHPDGDATDQEAAAAPLRALVASTSLAAGDRGLAAAAAFDDPYHRHTLAAELAAHDGEARSVVVGHLHDALAAAGDDPQKRQMAVKNLALAGEWPIEGASHLPGVDQVFLDYLHAIAALHQRDPSTAIHLTRLHRNDREEHAVILAKAYLADEKVDAAVDELKHAAGRFDSPQLLASAAHILFRRGRRAEAEDVATQAMGLLHDDTTDRRELRRMLIDSAGLRRDAGGVIAHARAHLVDDPDDVRVRWALVTALGHEIRLADAWDESREGEIEPRSEHEALIWLALEHRFGNLSVRVERALDMVSTYASSLDVCAMFVHISRRIHPDAIGADAAERVRGAIADIMVRFPDNAYFKVVDIPDDDSVIRLLRDMLTGRAMVYDAVADHVDRGRMPVGMLTVALGGTYTEALLRGLVRPFRTHAASADLDDRAAADAAGPHTEVVVDISSLVTASAIHEVWDGVVPMFHRLHGSSLALADLMHARDDVQDVTTTAQLDPQTGLPVMVETAQAGMSPLRSRIDWMWSVHGTITWSRVKHPENFPEDPTDERWLGWLSTLQLAQELALPLLCDDVVLRRVARERGVRCFPLSQLLRRLRDGRALPQGLDPARAAAVIAAR